MTILVLSLLAAGYGAFMLYQLYGWLRLPGCIPPMGDGFKTRVTLIIPTRNEEDHILSCLESIRAQTYPEDLLEVVVVNDHSTDRTESLVRDFAGGQVQLINLSDHLIPGKPVRAFKKKAIEVAISQSRGDLIVTTDGDCTAGKEWISSVVACFEKERCKLIAGPVGLRGERGFFQKLQSLDFLSLQGLTGSLLQLGYPVICNGANLAYDRKAFLELGGFEGVDHLASGDDVFLLQKIHRAFPGQCRFLKCREALVRTCAQPDVGSFFQQRIRWASKMGRGDSPGLLPLLLFLYAWNLLFPVLAISSFWEPALLNWFWGLLLYKTALELVFLFPVAEFFGKCSFLWWLPLEQFFHIPYILVAAFLGRFKTYQWKGRRVS